MPTDRLGAMDATRARRGGDIADRSAERMKARAGVGPEREAVFLHHAEEPHHRDSRDVAHAFAPAGGPAIRPGRSRGPDLVPSCMGRA